MLEPLAGALPAGAWVVDHTTTAVRPTAERVARWDARGVRYVHAPVFMAPANCAEGTGWMLISGDPARHGALQPALKAMTGSLVYLGPQPERAAALRFARKVRLRRCAAQPFGFAETFGLIKPRFSSSSATSRCWAFWVCWATWAGWPPRWAST